jgi:hypothetical protein
MDSAVECFTFAMNALGYAVAPSEFLDVTDEKMLQRISPTNILGRKSQAPQPGYSNRFPSLQAHWQSNQTLITTIVEQHDVSKHRSTIYVGGKYRTDPPLGFLEALGIESDSNMRFEYSPMEEIVLTPSPKLPRSKKPPSPAYKDLDTVESIGPQFCEFINQTSKKALADTISNIKLTHQTLLGRVTVVYEPNVSLYEDPDCTRERPNVIGIILARQTFGLGSGSLTGKRIVPTTRLKYYQKRDRVSDENSTNLEKVWGPTWYVDPDDDQKKMAWQSSAEFVGDRIL